MQQAETILYAYSWYIGLSDYCCDAIAIDAHCERIYACILLLSVAAKTIGLLSLYSAFSELV
jgi:hypothetical protein